MRTGPPERRATGGRRDDSADAERPRAGAGGEGGSVPAGGTLGEPGRGRDPRAGGGSRAWDVSGHEYIDYLLGSGPTGGPRASGGGRRRPRAARARLDVLREQRARHPPRRGDLQRRCRARRRSGSRSSGTEATLYAMRVARAFRRRDRILKFEGGFHGCARLRRDGHESAGPGPVPGGSAGFGGHPPGRRVHVLVAPFNDLETTSAIVDRHHDELAGVIVEPQRVLAPRPGFWRAARADRPARHPASSSTRS